MVIYGLELIWQFIGNIGRCSANIKVSAIVDIGIAEIMLGRVI
jgi:hypothetical protein